MPHPTHEQELQTPELAMKKYEILSIEPSKLAHIWVVSFKLDGGKTEEEPIEALDSNEAFLKFRNQMTIQAKIEVKKK